MTEERDVMSQDAAKGDGAPRENTAELDESSLERPREALARQTALARRRSAELRRDAARLSASSINAQPTALRRMLESDETVRESAYLLEEDPELAETLSEEHRERYKWWLRAPVTRLADASWEPPRCDPDRTYGLMLLDGLLGRRLRLGRATSIELLGAGDIMRPWQEQPESPIPAAVDWRVFTPTRVALLDHRITALIGQSPELTVAFAARLVRRSHSTAYLGAIGHVKRVEDRLLAMLWHLGGNWGQVTAQGVRIPFRLTHEALGELVGAYRPSVTIGLRTLRDSGEIIQTSDGRYVLIGTPPDWSRR